ncbi:Fc.00g091880.m01.CDS01 [Cosmosporella sp. VM-42]
MPDYGYPDYSFQDIDYQKKFFEIIGERRIDVILPTVLCFVVLFDSPFILIHTIIKAIASAIDSFYQGLFELTQDRAVGSMAEIQLLIDIAYDFRSLQTLITESQDWKRTMNTRYWGKMLCVVLFSIRGILTTYYVWANYDRLYDEFYGIPRVRPCHIPPEWLTQYQ